MTIFLQHILNFSDETTQQDSTRPLVTTMQEHLYLQNIIA
jgi:hypothetical protein